VNIVKNNKNTSSYLVTSESAGAAGGGTGVETRAGLAFVVKGAVELDVGAVSFKLS
jgi:hypothetical protein